MRPYIAYTQKIVISDPITDKISSDTTEALVGHVQYALKFLSWSKFSSKRNLSSKRKQPCKKVKGIMKAMVSARSKRRANPLFPQTVSLLNVMSFRSAKTILRPAICFIFLIVESKYIENEVVRFILFFSAVKCALWWGIDWWTVRKQW